MIRSGSPSRRLTVGVYDEPELVVSGVDGMLARQGSPVDVHPLLATDSGDQTMRVDVLVCDPVGRELGIEDYLALVATITAAPVLVFTWSNSPSSVRRTMEAGARGFVSKAAAGAVLAAAVHAVHQGRTVAPAARMASPVGVPPLSHREIEVLDLICRGMSNNEIAEDLYVSVNSVKTYVRQVYQKIGVNRRAQAVAWGLAHGF